MTNYSKTHNTQQNIYTFLDFEINHFSRELKQLKTPLKISKKSFDILLLLVKKQGQVVTKQEIINHVWPNQIVTDAALNKQLTRLKSDLMVNKPTEQAIIETVRGVGVKLIPVVHLKQIKSPSNQRIKLFWLLSIIALFLIGIVYFKTLPKQKTVPIENNSSESFTIVLIPAEKKVDWLNVGGLGYLSRQLHQQHKEIQSLDPKTIWFSQDNNPSLAIEISQRQGVDYVLSLKTLKKDKSYIADLLLRNKGGILAKQIIQSESLVLLFKKIDSWVVQQLNIKTKLSNNEFNDHPTDFALESYLRGKDMALHKSYEKAALLFQTAINEDALFFRARLALADVESELGN